MADHSIIDFISHLKDHYFNWGGRVIAHFFDGLMLRAQSDLLYAFLNLAIFSSSIFYSIKILRDSSPFSERTGFIELAFLIFGFSIFAKSPLQTLFWRTGAANYHWMFLILVLFLYMFKDWILIGKPLSLSPRSPSTYAKLALTLVVGATNENVGLALLALIGWQALQRWRRQEPLLNFEEALASSFLLLSTLFLLLAPGNSVRAAIAEPGGPLSIYARLHWWVESFLIFFARPDGILLLLTFSLLARAKNISTKDIIRQLKTRSLSQSLLLLAALLALVFIGHTGNFYGRKGFNVSYIFVLGLVGLLVEIQSKGAEKRETTLKRLGMILVFIAPVIKAGYDFQRIYNFQKLTGARESELLRQKQLGEANLAAPIILNPFDLEDLSENPENWTNQSYSNFLGITSLRGLPAPPSTGE